MRGGSYHFSKVWKHSSDYLLLIVDLLLELFTVAEGMVHIVVDDAGKALVIAQMPLIVLHLQHHFRL